MPNLNSSRNFKFQRPKDIENRPRNGQDFHFAVVNLPLEIDLQIDFIQKSDKCTKSISSREVIDIADN